MWLAPWRFPAFRPCIAIGLCAAVYGARTQFDNRAERARSTLTPAPTSAVDRRDGVFVWTRADAEMLDQTRAQYPGLAAGVHVATIGNDTKDGLRFRRALTPSAARSRGDVVLVVRFDDSLHGAWGNRSAVRISSALAPILQSIVRESRDAGARFDEIVLDYDAPTRALGNWADVVARVANGALGGLAVWVTSLPVHIDDGHYADLFASAVQGHILQLFDTGLDCTAETARALASDLVRHRMRFRVAVGGFERARARPLTTACWQTVARSWSSLPGYAGTWIFPAEQDLSSSLRHLGPDIGIARAELP